MYKSIDSSQTQTQKSQSFCTPKRITQAQTQMSADKSQKYKDLLREYVIDLKYSESANRKTEQRTAMTMQSTEDAADIRKRKLLRDYVIDLKISESANRKTGGEYLIAQNSMQSRDSQLKQRMMHKIEQSGESEEDEDETVRAYPKNPDE